MQNLLYSECGLKGLSGISNDVRDLEASSDPRARFALDYFVYRVGLHAGLLAAALGGLDAFVFTAGHRREFARRAVAHRGAACLARCRARRGANAAGRTSICAQRAASVSMSFRQMKSS